MDYGLGVDLGVTFTTAAVRRSDSLEMVSLGAHSIAMPSVVMLDEDDQLISGDIAERRGALRPDRVAREFKRRLGDPMPLVLAGQPHHATGLLAALLSNVVRDVSRGEGGPPADVVLTCPAVWGPYRREQFLEVPKYAGLERVRVVTEPEAAAAFYAASREIADGEAVLVYDLGGGTLDTTVLRAEDDVVHVIGEPGGIEHLGGVDFDHAVLRHVDAELEGMVGRLDLTDPDSAVALTRLARDCVLAKEALSVETETVIPVFLPGKYHEVPLSRATFEDMIRPLLRLSLDEVHRSVESARLHPQELSGIFLIGGSSQIPLVARMVHEEFDLPLRVDAHPKRAVALGAALISRSSDTVPSHSPVFRDALTGPALPRASPGAAREHAVQRRRYRVRGPAVAGVLMALVLALLAGTRLLPPQDRATAPEPRSAGSVGPTESASASSTPVPTSTPTTAPRSSSAPARPPRSTVPSRPSRAPTDPTLPGAPVVFTSPEEGQRIDGKVGVLVSGRVELRSGESIWIIDLPATGPTRYYRSSDSALPVSPEGRFTFLNKPVGSPADVGAVFRVLVVVADADCGRTLALEEPGPAGDVSFTRLPAGCVAYSRSVVVASFGG